MSENMNSVLNLFNKDGKPVTVGWTPEGFTLTATVTIPVRATQNGKSAKRRFTRFTGGNVAGAKRNEDGGWKLTATAVSKIRKLSARTKNPRGFYTKMAERYNVTPTAIWAVVKGRTWKGVV